MESFSRPRPVARFARFLHLHLRLHLHLPLIGARLWAARVPISPSASAAITGNSWQLSAVPFG